ncbi:MAG: TRAP transporter small permease [Roseicyclus sp.]|uniref:TRAP transporter small permease n=1 Tax=Roseicyclus sp. TaxID=1914329 RepID=UPI003A835823
MKTGQLPRGQFDIWLAMGSAMVLGLMMLFVFAGVVMRYAFNAPILGANEVLELASVAVVMLAIPYCTVEDGHVRIDLLDGALGRLGRWITEILYRVVGLAVLFFVTRSYFDRTLDAWAYADTTNLLRIPIWPFYGLVLIGMGLFAAILALQMLRMILRPGPIR